jgi:hypothetical protein
VTNLDSRGGQVNGVRRRWDTLTPNERRRLVAPGGGSCLLALRNDGGPFTLGHGVRADRRQDPCPVRATVPPHPPAPTTPFLLDANSGIPRDRTLPKAAKLVKDTDADAALVFCLSKADPLLVLRDLLGHSSVLTTEKYLKRLDTTRIYRDA